jgi:hypothetical protein
VLLLQKVQEIAFFGTVAPTSDILSWIDSGNDYLKTVWFIDESTFQIWGKVNSHNHHIWQSQNPHDVRKHEWDRQKWNMWFGLASAGVIRPFSFHGQTVTGAVNRDMPENCTVPQVPDGYIFQQDFWIPVTEFLIEQFMGI